MMNTLLYTFDGSANDGGGFAQINIKSRCKETGPCGKVSEGGYCPTAFLSNGLQAADVAGNCEAGSTAAQEPMDLNLVMYTKASCCLTPGCTMFMTLRETCPDINYQTADVTNNNAPAVSNAVAAPARSASDTTGCPAVSSSSWTGRLAEWAGLEPLFGCCPGSMDGYGGVRCSAYGVCLLQYGPQHSSSGDLVDPFELNPGIIKPYTDIYFERNAMYSCLLENVTSITYGAKIEFQVYDFDEDFCQRADDNVKEPQSDPTVGARICETTEQYYSRNYLDSTPKRDGTEAAKPTWAGDTDGYNIDTSDLSCEAGQGNGGCPASGARRYWPGCQHTDASGSNDEFFACFGGDAVGEYLRVYEVAKVYFPEITMDRNGWVFADDSLSVVDATSLPDNDVNGYAMTRDRRATRRTGSPAVSSTSKS